MLKTTSQQLIDSLGYEAGNVGQPLAIGATVDQTIATGTALMYSVPVGQVLLITHIIMQIDSLAQIGTRITSPQSSETLGNIQLADTDGTSRGNLTFRGFSRYRTPFTGGGGTPDWRAAQPGDVITWKLKYPIPVPAGWSVRQNQSAITWGNSSCVHGVLVSEVSARTMGYPVSNTGSPVTDRRFGITSSDGSVAGQTLIAARTGQSIRILDVHVRMQPETSSANTLTLSQGDGTKIFKCVNDNPAEFLEMSFSPGWYLKAGESLDLISDQESGSSVNITYEFVDEDDVPGDVWFAVVEPNVPSPGVTKYGNLGGAILGQVTGISTEATCYYPRRGTTATSPTQGFQHMLNGYCLSIQKNSTTANAADDTEQTRIAISTGSSAGLIELEALLMTQPNLQLTTTFSASSAEQCTWAVVDGVNLPGNKDDGSLWVDTIGFNSLTATPVDTANDIRDWAVCMWGRTISAKFTDLTNKGA